jgi:hypothetical protein
MANLGKLSPSDRAAFLQTANNLGLNPYEFGGLVQMESGFRPNVWGGDGGNYRGLIQFGPGARSEVGLPDRDMTIAEQLPYVEKYFNQRGYKPGMGIEKAYATVLVGNPGGSLDAKDSFGTSVGSTAPRMKEGGDLYKAAQSMLGDVDISSQPLPGQTQPVQSGQAGNVLNVYFDQGSKHQKKKDKAKSLVETMKEQIMGKMLSQAMNPLAGMGMPGMASGAFNPLNFLDS